MAYPWVVYWFPDEVVIRSGFSGCQPSVSAHRGSKVTMRDGTWYGDVRVGGNERLIRIFYQKQIWYVGCYQCFNTWRVMIKAKVNSLRPSDAYMHR